MVWSFCWYCFHFDYYENRFIICLLKETCKLNHLKSYQYCGSCNLFFFTRGVQQMAHWRGAAKLLELYNWQCWSYGLCLLYNNYDCLLFISVDLSNSIRNVKANEEPFSKRYQVHSFSYNSLKSLITIAKAFSLHWFFNLMGQGWTW